jgi:uncharacterized protein (TIGR02147 family)
MIKLACMYSIFRAKNYRTYMVQRVAEIQGQERGVLVRMARYLRIQPSYLTHVVQGKSDLSLEQAEQLNAFLGHSDTEAEYFLLMVSEERAGTSSLKKHFNGKRKLLEQEEDTLSARFKTQDTVDEELLEKYYDSWAFGAVHALISVPGYSTPESLSERLSLPVSRVTSILSELVRAGILERGEKAYRVGTRRIHLPRDEQKIHNFHSQWRQRSIEKLQKDPREDDLFYSSVITLSKTDLVEIRRMFSDTLQEAKAKIRDSKDETLAVLNIDLFEL